MTTKNLVLRTVYIDPEVDDKLRNEAFEQRVSKNDLMRRYIKLGMRAASVATGPAAVAAKPAAKAVARAPAARKRGTSVAAKKTGARAHTVAAGH